MSEPALKLVTPDAPAYHIAPDGLHVTRRLTLAEWLSCIEHASGARNAGTWALGDALNYGEDHWPERYAQALAETKYDYGSLRNMAWVARRTPKDRRRLSLSWSHHAAVARLEPEQADALLDEAVTVGGGRDWLRARVKELYPPEAPADIQEPEDEQEPVVYPLTGKIMTFGKRATVVILDAPPALLEKNGQQVTLEWKGS